MVVHFIGTKSRVLAEIEYYRRIIACIRGAGHTLANPWVEDVYKLAQKGSLKKAAETWGEVDRANAVALSKADVVIVETTTKGFFAGYQVSQAVLQKKPLLLLTRDRSPAAISGISTPLGFIKSVVYNPESLDKVLKDFFAENTVDTKDLRFNFFLDRPIYSYLQWKSTKTGKTKAEVVRSFLQKGMDEDNEYMWRNHNPSDH